MKVGDLVKVSNKGFSAIGYIAEITRSGYYMVHYFSQSGYGGHPHATGGLWTDEYTQLLKEVKHEKETGKT